MRPSPKQSNRSVQRDQPIDCPLGVQLNETGLKNMYASYTAGQFFNEGPA